jgi:RNA-binding protein
MTELTNAEVRKFKAMAQLMKPMLKIGHAGLSPEFIKMVDQTLKSHELIKIKFDDLKDQRKLLAPELAEKTSSHLVTLLGNVVVLYRKKVEN